jgi:uncharacterized phage protein (TIGR01671 family)
MREIKFRAWDKKEKKMYYDVQDTYDFMINNGGCFEESFKDVLEYDNYVVMQYTNCYDINGKEIYEGDIIRLEGVDDREIGSTWEHIGKIVYKRGAFFVCYFDYYADGDEELICDAQVEFGTVIGNVYENKELLEG